MAIIRDRSVFPTFVFRYPVERQHHPSFEELSISAIRQRVKTITAPKPDDLTRNTSVLRPCPKNGKHHHYSEIHPSPCLPGTCRHGLSPAVVLSAWGKSRVEHNVTLGLFVIFAYYALTLATERVARSDIAPAEIVLPFPFVVFFFTSIYMTWCVRMERLPGVVRLGAGDSF